MPELPEVEAVRRQLEPALRGARIERVLLRRHNLRRPFPADFAARLLIEARNEAESVIGATEKSHEFETEAR